MAEEKKTAGVPEKSAKKKNNIFKRIAKWFRELRSELKKVTWPTRKQIIKETCVVLGIVAVCGITLWAFDYIAGLGIRTIITLAG